MYCYLKLLLNKSMKYVFEENVIIFARKNFEINLCSDFKIRFDF